MHGNEFERQVQQRTEGLKVTPSEGLWDKIEAQLPKERKRRVAFWWWLPLLLLAVGGWWWMARQPAANNTAATPSTEVTTTTLQANTVPLTTLGEGIDSGKALPQQPGLPVQQPAVGNDANIAMAPPATGGSASTRLWRPVRRGANVYIAPVFVNPSYPMNIKEALPDREDGGQTVNGMGFNKAIPDKAHGDVSWKPLAWAPTALPFDGRRTMAATMRQGQRVAIALQNNPMAKPPTEKKGWEWGLTLGGGVSWRQDRLFVDSVNNYDLGRAFNNAIISGGSGGLGNFGGFGRPQKPGLTLSVGLQANRKLAKRWSLQTGLEYTYSSYRQPVNLLLPDTSIVVITGVTNAPIRNSYRTGDSAIVAAGFHFINLPIALQYHLGRNRRWHLQTGLVLGYTVATNTLIYNPVNVGYFKSRQSLNGFNLSWLGGIAFQPKPNSAALAGIRASYNISSLVKQSIQVQRLMSAQVYWQIPLRKK